jgi:DEAD/DEAH box helicase domain-containing protein
MDLKEFIKELKGRKDLRVFVHHEVIPPIPASFEEPEEPLTGEVKAALKGLGIKKLYRHQALGIDIVREGKNVVAMTPTASGKSLIYNVPVD